MDQPIYFSKVEMTVSWYNDNIYSTIFLDVVQQQLSYQVYEWVRVRPSTFIDEYNEETEIPGMKYSYPAKQIRVGKNDFQPISIKEKVYQSKVVFSYGMTLSDEQMDLLLPYCNALNFEPYRHKDWSMVETGLIVEDSGHHLIFCGITDSYIPKIELETGRGIIEKYWWPSDKLYYFLVATFLRNNSQLKGWGEEFSL